MISRLQRNIMFVVTELICLSVVLISCSVPENKNIYSDIEIGSVSDLNNESAEKKRVDTCQLVEMEDEETGETIVQYQVKNIIREEKEVVE